MIETLQRVVDVAVQTLEACDYAGIFLLEGGGITTPVRSSEIVVELDALQHQAGEGPCRHAVVRGGSACVGNRADDDRWQNFRTLAIEAGIRSVLAFPLGSSGTHGALNLHARYPQAFGVVDRANGQILATPSDLALSAAETHESEEIRVENLELALSTRAMIGQATGILMDANGSQPTRPSTSCGERRSISTSDCATLRKGSSIPENAPRQARAVETAPACVAIGALVLRVAD